MQWHDGWTCGKCHTYSQAHLLSFLSTNQLFFCPVNKCSFLSIQSLSLNYDKYWTKLGLLTTYWLDFVLKMPIPHLKIRTNAGQNLDICPVLVQKQLFKGTHFSNHFQVPHISLVPRRVIHRRTLVWATSGPDENWTYKGDELTSMHFTVVINHLGLFWPSKFWTYIQNWTYIHGSYISAPVYQVVTSEEGEEEERRQSPVAG